LVEGVEERSEEGETTVFGEEDEGSDVLFERGEGVSWKKTGKGREGRTLSFDSTHLQATLAARITLRNPK